MNKPDDEYWAIFEAIVPSFEELKAFAEMYPPPTEWFEGDEPCPWQEES